MKKFITLIMLSLISIGIYSCSKNDSTPVTYTVSGLTDVSLAQGERDVLALTISNTSSFQEQVSLDIEGLPTGISASFSNKSGTPGFTTNVTISNTSAQVGSYSCNLAVKGSKTGMKHYPFTLIVNNAGACGLAGPYNYIKTCSGITATDNLIRFSSSNTLRFSNFGGNGWVAYADVNCVTQKIEVPLQSVGNNNQISGTGDFGVDGTINIHYTVENSVTNIKTTCNLAMLRSN